MRASRRARVGGVCAAVVAGLGAWLAPGALADPSGTATTGNATSITGTSAVLNGVIDPRVARSVWFFQYSASPHFSAADVRDTPFIPLLHEAFSAVSATVLGLVPDREYWFRMIVAEPSVPGVLASAPTYYAGGVRPLTEGTFGIAAPSGSRMRLAGDRLPAAVTCTGWIGAPCTGTESLTLTRTNLPCGTSAVAQGAPRSETVTVPVSSECRRLVRAAGVRGARATLRFAGADGGVVVTRWVRVLG